MLLSAKTEFEWIDEIAKIPILGGIFLLLVMFIPAVLLSLLAQAVIPGLHDDIGFTKAMLLLMPGWNLFLWVTKIKIYFFFLPSWITLGAIALVKFILLITGINDGYS